MTKLLKNNHSTFSVVNFIESLNRTTPTPEYLYFFIGRDAVWANEAVPPAATEDVAFDITTRNNMIAMKRILAADCALVVQRYNWTSGTVYDKYDAADATLFTKDFYVYTTSGNVYKCLNNNSGGTSVIEPTGTSTAAFTTGDGYQWKFMYNLSGDMISRFLTTDWLPVPYGAQRSSLQTAVEAAAVYSSGNPPNGHGASAGSELGVKSIMISKSFEGSEGSVISTSTSFRQIGILRNPELVASGFATGSIYTLNDSNTVINQLTGEMLYVENRIAVTRDPDQTESYKPIITF